VEVLEKWLDWGWYLECDAPTHGDDICINMLQFAAARGKTELVRLLLDHGLDPDAHEGESPRAVELAAVYGRVETFALLTATLEIDSNSDWFQLAQLLVWAMPGGKGKACYDWKPSEEFKKLLSSIPPAKVSKESVCGSTLLQSFASAGNRAGVALLLQHGAEPTATTANNPNLPERWAYNNNHVGVLAELVKVKEVAPDIMESSLGNLVLKEEEREWRRKMLEMISLLARKSLGTEQEQDNVNVANIFNPFV